MNDENPKIKMQYIQEIREMHPQLRWRGYCEVDDRLREMRARADFDETSKGYDDLLWDHECWWIALSSEEQKRAQQRAADECRPEEIRVYKDGDSWCAVRREGFINIQECAAGFGEGPAEAVTELIGAENQWLKRSKARGN